MSEITVNEELNKAIQASLNPDDIRSAVQTELEKQGATAAAEKLATDQAAEAAAKAAAVVEPAAFTRVETIGGREFTFEAGSELELERMVNNAYKVAFAVQIPEEREREFLQVPDPAIAAAAKKVADENAAAAKVELELKFKRGDISAADYIEQSGAMGEYLAKQGVPLESLKAAITQTQATTEAKSWEDAVEDFKKGPGQDWPGGKNINIIGMKLQTIPYQLPNGQWGVLADAPDKVAALAQAFQSMKDNGEIIPVEVAASTTVAPVVTSTVATPAPAPVPATSQPVAQRTPSTSSSLFGRSSGTSERATPAVATGAKVDVPADATPQEIMAAYKTAQLAAGKDINAAFVETFSARRA